MTPVLTLLDQLSTEILAMEAATGFKRGNLAEDARKTADALAEALGDVFNAETTRHFAQQDVRLDRMVGGVVSGFASPFVRGADGVLHVVALSGGHDSTAMAFLLKEQNPATPYNYVCTPTGNELPAMFDHWLNLGERLGRRLVPIVAGTLHSIIRQEKMLPNFRARFCTRRLKIEPYRKFLIEQASLGPIVSYVGLRADEEGRAGGAYGDIGGIEMRFPLREMGFGEDEVQATLRRFNVVCPDRTDCGECYHQRLGEWFEYWRDHRPAAMKAVALEAEMGGTFRTPGRDRWPTALADLFGEFEQGRTPTISLNRMARERMNAGACRVCSL